VQLDVTTGDVKLDGVTCESLTSTGDTGDILLKRVIVAGEMKVERSTGDVELDASDAATILIRTSTGDVEGTLLSEKIFMVSTSTGDKDVPKTTGGIAPLINVCHIVRKTQVFSCWLTEAVLLLTTAKSMYVTAIKTRVKK
jgi:hypothetical protein